MTAREYAQTHAAARAARDRRNGRRAPRRRLDDREGQSGALARARASALGEAAPLRPGARPRLARPDADRPLARDSRARRRSTTSSPGSSTSSAAGRRRRVVVPEAIPPERLARYGARPPKLRRYPGLKEEYYLADFEPDRVDVPDGQAAGRRPHAAGGLALPPARQSALPRDVLERLGRDAHLHAVVLPRTAEQRESIRALGLPSLVVPDRAVDAQSLISAAAVVVSAGGTMNREAVALGTPVYTTFGGRLGAVDEALIREGRLVRLRARDRPRPGRAPAAARAATTRPERPARPDARLRIPRGRGGSGWS